MASLTNGHVFKKKNIYERDDTRYLPLLTDLRILIRLQLETM